MAATHFRCWLLRFRHCHCCHTLRFRHYYAGWLILRYCTLIAVRRYWPLPHWYADAIAITAATATSLMAILLLLGHCWILHNIDTLAIGHYYVIDIADIIDSRCNTLLPIADSCHYAIIDIVIIFDTHYIYDGTQPLMMLIADAIYYSWPRRYIIDATILIILHYCRHYAIEIQLIHITPPRH